MVRLFDVVQQDENYLAVMRVQSYRKVISQEPIANFGKRKEDAYALCEWCRKTCGGSSYGLERILKWVKHCDPEKKMKLEMVGNRAFIEEL